MSNFLFQSIFCVFIAGLTLYAAIEKNNQLTLLQILIPQLEKEVKTLHKQNEKLQYEIDQFESPLHLMNLLKRPEFKHLKYPRNQNVLIISRTVAEPERDK